MESTIPNLWSNDISVGTLSPLAILRSQAGWLRQMTQGYVEADVATESYQENEDAELRYQHHLDLIAPMLSRARFRILTASHAEAMVYPVTVRSEGLTEEDSYGIWPSAYGEEEFLRILKKILRSDHTRSKIDSIIARSNDSKSVLLPQTDENES